MSYIGQTKNTFEERYNGNGRWWVRHSNCYLQNSVNKNGHDSFYIEIIEHDIKTLKELNELEKFYIKKFNTLYPDGYNFSIGGDNHSHVKEIGDKISNILSKGRIYKLKSPTGEIFEVKNLRRFCKEHNLRHCGALKIVKKDVQKYNGWTLPETKLKKWIFISPEGEKFIVVDGWRNHGLRSFCKNHNLYKENVLLAYKKGKKYKNWTINQEFS